MLFKNKLVLYPFLILGYVLVILLLFFVYKRKHFGADRTKEPSTDHLIRSIDQHLKEHTVAKPKHTEPMASNAPTDATTEAAPETERETELVFKDPEEYFALGELHHHGKFNREKNPRMAEENYMKCIEKTEDDRLKGRCYIALANLHEDNKSYPEQIIDHYLKALECGYEESILHIGKIYMNGIHPYVLPEKMVAARIFSTFSSFSNTIEPWCKLHLQEINNIQYKDLDATPQSGVHYRSLPYNIVQEMMRACDRIRGQTVPYKSSFNRSWLRNYDEEDRRARQHDKKRASRVKSVLLRLPQQVVKNDSQNVHDHSVQNIGNQIIKTVDAQVRTRPSDFEQNKRDLLDQVDEQKFPHVRRVCDSLNTSSVHSRFNKTEADVFNMMWTKVKDNPDQKDIFVDNLNSGVEDDHVVCSTGKIMRMLSSLDATDDSIPDVKPDWVIRQEIMATISNTIEGLNKSEKKQYNSDNNERMRSLISDRVRKKCREDYKDVLAPEILEMHLGEYLEFV